MMMKVLGRLFILSLFLCIQACGKPTESYSVGEEGGSTGSEALFDENGCRYVPFPPIAFWSAPTQYDDGTPLTSANILGYEIAITGGRSGITVYEPTTGGNTAEHILLTPLEQGMTYNLRIRVQSAGLLGSPRWSNFSNTYCIVPTGFRAA